MAVGFLLVVVLAFTYPQNAPQLGLVNLGCYNWSSPLSHVRLLSLPIAKKYNLQGVKHCGFLFFQFQMSYKQKDSFSVMYKKKNI